MKRLVRYTTTVTFEFNIDIITSEFQKLTANTDLTDTEYDNFIDNMIMQFRMKGYKLDKDEDYTHASNYPGSLSEYYTFYKWIGDVQVVVVVNIRVSDHSDRDRRGLTAEDKRDRYVARISNEIANRERANAALPRKLEIIFDDEHLKSFTSAELAINSKIKKIESEIAELQS